MGDDRRWDRRVVDGAVALTMLGVGWVSTAATRMTEPEFVYTERDSVFLVLLALATLPYAGRRRWPSTAFLVGLFATTALWSLGYNGSVLPLILLAGAYWVAAARPVTVVLACLVTAVACFTFLLLVDGAPLGWVEWVAATVSIVGATSIGYTSRLRGDLAESRAAAAEEAARRRTSEDRLRLSAELHDIVGHSLGIIAVQAGVGRHLMATDEKRAAEALDVIAQISRTSLDEVRRAVTRLREDGDGVDHVGGVDDLGILVETVRSTGLTVSLTVPPPPDVLPRPVGAAIFRITQEALTNVVRHAHASFVSVEVTLTGGRAQVCVRDDGRSVAAEGGPPEPRHGITGMRERAEALGGTLSAGPVRSGGFVVAATFPVGR